MATINEWNDENGQTGNHTGYTGANYISESDNDTDDTSNDTFDEDEVDDVTAEGTDPDETPERHESENEGTGYTNETELETLKEGNDASYSEKNDVTPPTPHEFPSVGNAETDFVSRPHGRTTGRMVGHEPGTENNL